MRYDADGAAIGDRNLYGIPLGILMLESRFPRIPGDAGNAATWPFPVLYRVVSGATPDRVVRRLDPEALLAPFVAGALELERAGVAIVTTNCGYLVRFQRELQAQVGVPVLTSSLLQVPWIGALLPASRRRVGILTIDAGALTPAHLAAAGIDARHQPVAIVGLESAGGHFTDAILNDRDRLDPERSRREHEAAARRLIEQHADVGAIVLECTNMPPYAHAIAAATGLPVYDITTLVTMAVHGTLRRPFRERTALDRA